MEDLRVYLDKSIAPLQIRLCIRAISILILATPHSILLAAGSNDLRLLYDFIYVLLLIIATLRKRKLP